MRPCGVHPLWWEHTLQTVGAGANTDLSDIPLQFQLYLIKETLQPGARIFFTCGLSVWGCGRAKLGLWWGNTAATVKLHWGCGEATGPH